MELTTITWQALTSLLGLSTILAVLVIPAIKAFGVKDARWILASGFLAGQVFAQIAVLYSQGASWKGVADAFLLGLLAAGAATGLHQVKKQFLPGKTE